jgi:outer membrane protein, heavy metal efflux system
MARVLFAMLSLFAAGCATLDPSSDFDRVRAQLADRTGQEVDWHREARDTSEAAALIRELLERELTPDDAVRVALLASPRVQAIYDELEIARAGYVQAGLVANPVFSGAYLHRSGGGHTWELEVAQSFTSLLFLPLRRARAGAELDLAEARITSRVLDLMLDIKKAYFGFLAAQHRVELLRDAAEASSAAWEMAGRLRNAGNITELSLLLRRTASEEDKLALAEAELGLAEAREMLSTLLGLWGEQAGGLRVPAVLPSKPDDQVPGDNLEAASVKASLDLAASAHALAVTSRGLSESQIASALGDVEIGAAFERDSGERWQRGPAWSLSLPIFDFGQAARARSLAVLRRQGREHEAIAIEVRSAARRAGARLESVRARSRYFDEVLLPLHEQLTRQALLQHNAMTIGVFELLEVKHRELSALARANEVLLEYWLARSEVETLLAGRMPASFRSTSTTFPPFTAERGGH